VSSGESKGKTPFTRPGDLIHSEKTGKTSEGEKIEKNDVPGLKQVKGEKTGGQIKKGDDWRGAEKGGNEYRWGIDCAQIERSGETGGLGGAWVANDDQACGVPEKKTPGAAREKGGKPPRQGKGRLRKVRRNLEKERAGSNGGVLHNDAG